MAVPSPKLYQDSVPLSGQILPGPPPHKMQMGHPHTGDFNAMNNRAPILTYFKHCASFYGHWWIQTGVTVWKRSSPVKISDFSVPYDLEIWQMTLKNNRAPLLTYFTLCASFHSHWWIQIEVTVWNSPIWIKTGDFLSHVTLKFDGWSRRTIGHLSYATLCIIP